LCKSHTLAFLTIELATLVTCAPMTYFIIRGITHVKTKYLGRNSFDACQPNPDLEDLSEVAVDL